MARCCGYRACWRVPRDHAVVTGSQVVVSFLAVQAWARVSDREST